MAQLAVAGVGAAVGFLIGGPTGALIGFSIGSTIGALLFPQHSKGPNPNEVKIQNSAYGVPIPWTYGAFRQAGNIIWRGKPIKHSNEQSAGKGGPTVTSYYYTVSFAVGLCEGPISGIRRIWANGKLIYDVSNPSNFAQISGSASMSTAFRVYLGDENQLPDPTIESYEGVGNVEAFRGLAYVVFTDFNLQPYGGYIPQFSFEVISGVAPVPTSQVMSLYTASNATGLPYFYTPRITCVGALSFTFNNNGGNGGNLYTYTMTTGGAMPNGQLATAVFPVGGNVTPAVLADQDCFVTSVNQPDGSTALGLFDSGTTPYASNEPTLLLAFGKYFSGPSNWSGDTNFVVNRGDVYFQAGTVSGYSGTVIQRVKINNQIDYSLFNDTANSWVMLGVTASYLYMLCTTQGSQKISRFDRKTLGYVGDVVTWSTLNAVISGGLAAGVDPGWMKYWAGCVLSDDVYYLVQNSGGAVNMSVYRCGSDNSCAVWASGALFQTNPSSSGVQNFTAINENLLGFASSSQGGTQHKVWYAYKTLGKNTVQLSAIVSDICSRAGLASSQYDVTTLTDNVIGYGVTNHSSPRSNIGPLQSIYMLDVADSEGKLKFKKRGTQPVGTINFADLGVASSSSDEAALNPIISTLADESELSRDYSLTYLGYNNDYNENTQRAFRPNAVTNKQSTVSAPIVLGDADALQRVQAMLWSEWIARTRFQFNTSITYLQYEPGDVMWLQRADGSKVIVRLTKCTIESASTLKWEAVLEEPSLYPNGSYTAAGGAAGAQSTPQLVDYAGPSLLRVLDCPALRVQDTSPGLYVAAAGPTSSWGGAQIQMSRSGTAFSPVDIIANPAVMGVANTALGNWSGGNIPDESNSVDVQLYGSSAVYSASWTDFLNEVNVALLGSEVIMFRNVSALGNGVFRLSGLLRGRLGTEWAIGTHVAQELFTFLTNSGLLREAISVSDIGQPIYTRAQTISTAPTLPSAAIKTTVGNAGCKPLSPAFLNAFPGAGAGTGALDVLVKWTRRARVNAEWLNNIDVPLDEATESYQVGVLSGSTTKRTATVTAATSFLYTRAMQTADGFVTGNPVTFSVAQNSDQGLLGYASTVQVNIP